MKPNRMASGPIRCSSLDPAQKRHSDIQQYAMRLETVELGYGVLAVLGARLRQLSYISDLVSHYAHLVVMGDFNCGCSSQEYRYLIERTNLQTTPCDMMTFPSWRPSRKLDHILASASLKVAKSEVLNYAHSDHLPISLEIELPKDLVLPIAA